MSAAENQDTENRETRNMSENNQEQGAESAAGGEVGDAGPPAQPPSPVPGSSTQPPKIPEERAEQQQLLETLWAPFNATRPEPVPLTRENLEECLQMWQQAHDQIRKGNPPVNLNPPNESSGQALSAQDTGLPVPDFSILQGGGASFMLTAPVPAQPYRYPLSPFMNYGLGVDPVMTANDPVEESLRLLEAEKFQQNFVSHAVVAAAPSSGKWVTSAGLKGSETTIFNATDPSESFGVWFEKFERQMRMTGQPIDRRLDKMKSRLSGVAYQFAKGLVGYSYDQVARAMNIEFRPCTEQDYQARLETARQFPDEKIASYIRRAGDLAKRAHPEGNRAMWGRLILGKNQNRGAPQF